RHGGRYRGGVGGRRLPARPRLGPVDRGHDGRRRRGGVPHRTAPRPAARTGRGGSRGAPPPHAVARAARPPRPRVRRRRGDRGPAGRAAPLAGGGGGAGGRSDILSPHRVVSASGVGGAPPVHPWRPIVRPVLLPAAL